MKHTNDSPHPYEPTKDELPSNPAYHFKLDRRKFVQLFGGGITVAFVLHDLFSFAGEVMPSDSSKVPTSQVGAWIHIGEDGKVSVYTGKVEVGQNIRTSLSQIVAEELYVPLSSIHMIMGDTDLVPYDAGTFGSRSTPQMGTQLRRAAATLRQALLEMAAKNWNIEVSALRANEGAIINPQNQNKVTYGALTKGQQLLIPINDDVTVRPASEWKVAGRTVPKVGGRDFITGRHQFVSDMKLPGMLYGKVLRAPSYGAQLVDVDVSQAQAMPGVVVVRDGAFVGVVAPNIRTANKALLAIRAKWEETKHQVSSDNIFDHLVISASGGNDNRGNSKGDVEEGFKAADFTHHKKYNLHYIAHVPLEPRAAVAEWKDGKLTVWTGTQRPFGVQESLAETFRISKEQVRVIMPDTGSGYGGKHTGEAAIEAARLAQAARKPVKVVWTRKEEFTWAYFRPAGVIEVHSGVKKDGSITAWKFTNYNSGPAGLNTQYAIAHQRIAHIPSDTPLRQGSYRGLAAPANVFARECHIEDMARLVRMDSFAFRMKNLNDERLKAVLEAAVKAFGWRGMSQQPVGRGFGMACGFEKGGYVGTCAEVNVGGNKQVKVVRIVQAFECGAIVNPHHLEAQVLGCIVQALGGALFEAIDFADGKIKNGSMAAYRVPRFSDMPKIEIITIDRKDLPSAGAGEASFIGVAPAIRNAILDATGVGLSSLPLLPNGKLV